MRRAGSVAGLLAVGALVAACGEASQTEGRQAPIRRLVYAQATSFAPSSSWLWRARPDGTGAVRLGRGEGPVVSPDGRWIAFLRVSRYPRRATLLVMAAAGGQVRALRSREGPRGWFSGLTWSPDSSRLAFLEDDGLALVERSDWQARLLVRQPPNVSLGSLSFSPDGSGLAYERADTRGGDVYTVSVTGGEPKRLTRDHGSSAPVWGPGGIAFNRSGFGRGDVWLVRPDGSGARRLTETGAGIYPVAFSADGSRLLAANPASHNGRLWAVDAESGRARDLTGWVGDLFPQGISGDGETVLAAVGCGGVLSLRGLVETIPFGGGAPTVIGRGPCRASWNA